MKLLAIETSCDETAISLIEVEKEGKKTKFKILGNEVSSQIALHTQYGGVFPMMAKREHGKNIIHVLEKVLKESKMCSINKKSQPDKKLEKKVYKLLDRENEIQDRWMEIMPFIKKPKIDAIAVTTGPGLEPALWVGISFAKALSTYWNIPIVKVNHMEGHVFSIFPKKGKTFLVDVNKDMFPMLSLLVSGGHTELVLVKDGMKYKKIGQTRDDAAGEAFDKVARMLGLPYPGGPQISRLAKEEKNNPGKNDGLKIELPRPMIYSKDYDFSYSGLKTAVLYLIRDIGELTYDIKKRIAKEFADAAFEVLIHKTIKAIKEYKIKTLIVGGGVSADPQLKEMMFNKIKEDRLKVKTFFPSKGLSGDNALMIAIAGYYQAKNKKFVKNIKSIKAQGNLSL